MLTTYHGVVYPNQCDAMGHCNVAHYIAAFDQASWHLLYACGYSPRWGVERGEGFADVRYEIDFRHEMRAGALFSIESCVVRTGTRTIMTYHCMSIAGELHVAAELRAVSVFFDLKNRVAKSLPDSMRSGAVDFIDTSKTKK